MCAQCGRKTSVTAGTIFHRTRTPLRTWFATVWFVTSQKNGISALGLQRVLGVGSYETAWAWMHKRDERWSARSGNDCPVMSSWTKRWSAASRSARWVGPAPKHR